jgi:DNA-binding response OmpR family regulator
MLAAVRDTALILVVEDDAAIAEAIRLRLVGEGFAVETAADGIGAVAACARLLSSARPRSCGSRST